MVDALFFFERGIRVEHGETMEWHRMPRGAVRERLSVRLKARTRGGLAYR